MKTHILFALLTAFLMTACASHEGRTVSSTEDEKEQENAYYQRAFPDGGSAGRL